NTHAHNRPGHQELLYRVISRQTIHRPNLSPGEPERVLLVDDGYWQPRDRLDLSGAQQLEAGNVQLARNLWSCLCCQIEQCWRERVENHLLVHLGFMDFRDNCRYNRLFQFIARVAMW